MNTINEIYSELKTSFEEETGLTLNDGGDMALRFRALAAQLVSLQAQAEHTQRQCFPDTAVGDALDSHAALRAISRRPAAKASGTLRFSAAEEAQSAISIPAGTRVISADETEFTVTAGGSIAVGSSYVDLAAQAVKAGKAGNLAAGSAVFMELPPVGIISCTVPSAFTGGADAESDESLRARVLESYRSVKTTGNAAYYLDTALSVNGVAAATVQPRKSGRGTVGVTVADANGEASDALLAAVSSRFNARREICVDVTVTAPTASTVNVAAEIYPAAGYDADAVCESVEDAVRGFFTAKLLGKGVSLAELGSIIFAVEGVDNYSISAPASDVISHPARLPVLGTLSISEAGA